MTQESTQEATAGSIELIEATYRTESRAVLATLIRLLGDCDLAEEALHEAFRAALEKWLETGVPDNPRPWLISAGRLRAIDNLAQRIVRAEAWTITAWRMRYEPTSAAASAVETTGARSTAELWPSPGRTPRDDSPKKELSEA